MTTKIKISDLKTLEQLETMPFIFPVGGINYIDVNLPVECATFFYMKWHKKTKIHSPHSFVNFLNLYGKQGIEANINPMHLPENSYWKIDAVSNSDLSALKDKLMGKPKRNGGRNWVFGSCFHEQELEPHIHNRDTYNLRPSEHYALDQMGKALRKDPIYRKVLPIAKTEVTRVWEAENEIICKGKLDMWVEDFLEVIDLKTTAAKSQKEFEEMMLAYDYDRQCFHYAEGAKAARIRIIGIQKIEPFNVYHFARGIESEFMKNGKRKRNYLLKRHKEMNLS